MTITNRPRQQPIEGIGSEKVHMILRRCEVGKLSVKGSDCSGLKLMPLTDEQKNVCNYSALPKLSLKNSFLSED